MTVIYALFSSKGAQNKEFFFSFLFLKEKKSLLGGDAK